MSVLSGLAGRLPRALGRPHGLPSRYRWVNAFLAAAVIGLGVGAYFTVNSSSTPATQAAVQTAAVARGVVLSSVSASGNIAAASQLSVGFQTAGTLSAVEVKVGQQVKVGQVLGRVDPTDAKAAVSEAEASLTTAQANLELALTGETAQQRASDAVSVRQAAAQVTSAKTSLATAQQQLKQDQAATGVAQTERQLRTDLGSERAAVAQLKTDLGTNADLPAAQAVVTAAQQTVTADQDKQHTDTVTQGDLQTNQAQWNQYLSSDKAAEATAQANNDSAGVALYTGRANNDQTNLDGIALKLQQLSQTLSNDSYQLTQDQSALTTAQSTVSAIKSDQASLSSSEAKIVSDRAAIATAKTSQAATLVKDRQSIASANQQISSAELSLRSSKLSTAIKQAPATAATLAQDRASVLQAQVSLTAARLTLTQTTLRAPAAGVVSAVSGVVGGSVSGSGTSSSTASASSSSASTTSSSSTSNSASSSSSFVTLVGVKGLQVTAAFSESDVANIAVGQPATVTVSALPTEELAAHVIGIDETGTTSSSVVEYTVTFALDRSEPKLKPGMSASVSVTVAEHDNVLNVPSAAVTGSGSNARVTVVKNGKQSTVAVVAGLKGDSTTEIVSGLKAGEQVVTSTGTTSFGSASSRTSTTGSGSPPSGVGGGAFPGGGGGFPGGGAP